MRRCCQLEHSLSAPGAKRSIELESMEKREVPAANKEPGEVDGVLTKLHNIRLEWHALQAGRMKCSILEHFERHIV